VTKAALAARMRITYDGELKKGLFKEALQSVFVEKAIWKNELSGF